MVAHYIIPGVPSGIAQLAVSSLLAVVAYRVANISLFALNRSFRFGGPLVIDWFHDVATNWSSQLLSAPLAVVIATIGSRTDSLVINLTLTALSALGLPIARRELAYYQRSQQIIDEIVEALVRAIEGVDPSARAHGDRVSALARETGRRLGMSERELLALRLASRLHDVGLITGHEAVADEAHLVNVSSQILRRFPDAMIAEIVQSHHERWDGKGNRDGRSHEAIPLGARILGAAEIYDCLREGLYPYETPLSPQDAASHLISLAGTELDPKVVMILLRVATEKGGVLPLAG
jgi:hypothetical protein